MYSLQLLVELARLVLFVADQTAESPIHSPTYDLALQAEALGIDPDAAQFLVVSLAHIQTRKPMLYAASVERPGDSDLDCVILGYSEKSLARGLDEEGRALNANSVDETSIEEGRVGTFHDRVMIY